MKRLVFLTNALSMLVWLISEGATSHAQVIQLPSVRNFSYSGSAWVPDGGTTSLGGISYTSTSQSSRGWGPFAGRNVGGVSGGSSFSASVTIIDLQALDDAILNANVPRDPNAAPIISAGSPAAGGGRNFLTGFGGEPFANSRDAAPDPNQWQRVMAGTSRNVKTTHPSEVEADIRFYLRQGKEAENANRILAARVYYRMAVDAMTPDMIERYHQVLAERKAAEEKRREANQPGKIQF